MINSIIKCAGTIPAGDTSDGISSIDIPEDSGLWAIWSWIHGVVPAASAATEDIYQLKAELSFLSTNQFGVNDARGAIVEIATAWYVDASASGSGAKASESENITFDKPIVLNAGERIHCHGHSSDALLTGSYGFMLFLQTKGGGRRDCRRR